MSTDQTINQALRYRNPTVAQGPQQRGGIAAYPVGFAGTIRTSLQSMLEPNCKPRLGLWRGGLDDPVWKRADHCYRSSGAE